MSNATAYKRSGVDIDAGARFVRMIAPLVAATARNGARADLGGFGGVFDLKAAGFKDPLLVAATDGVGTKLALAVEAGRLDAMGRDLVAMCVNDVIAQGAEPLFFLDYLACAELDVDEARPIIVGIAEACKESGCALIGGETAEMPGLCAPDMYELAGFALGAVERDTLLPTGSAKPGDIILGLASDGIHANGFSLIRKILKDTKTPLADKADMLLAPTRLYVRPLLRLLRESPPSVVRGIAHITGGGLTENLPRAIGTKGLSIQLDITSVPLPPALAWAKDAGRLTEKDMLATFNCGIGMAVIVAPDYVKEAGRCLEDAGETVFEIGCLTN